MPSSVKYHANPLGNIPKLRIENVLGLSSCHSSTSNVFFGAHPLSPLPPAPLLSLMCLGLVAIQ